MSDSEVLSIRLPRKLKAKLEKLAKLSGRSKSWHAAEALDAYVDWQTPIVKSIREAQESARNGGKTYTTEEVMARTNKIIERAIAKRAAKRA
jgi:RHH-type transcriptional regulator, rel operon repressor / antitoxin RelB